MRRTLVASIVSVAGLVAAAPLASADPCPPLNVGCVVDDTTTTAGGVVDDTTTTVGDTVDDTATTVDTATNTVGDTVDTVTTTVGDTVDTATNTVGDTVDTVTTTVGDTVGGAGQTDPGTILEGSDPSGTLPGGGAIPGPGETPTGGGPAPTNGGGTHTGTVSSGSRAPRAVDVAVGSSSIAPAVNGGTPTAVAHPSPMFVDGGGGVLVAAARLVRTLAIPLALILLVIGFLFVQNRIDRRDPKLALAPVGSEHLTFT